MTSIEQIVPVKEQFILRFPHGMRGRLKSLASANRRSMNAELLRLIEIGMASAGDSMRDPPALLEGHAMKTENGGAMD